MLEPVSVGLKFGFLAVLYLFLMWVAWSAFRDLRRGSGRAAIPVEQDATGMYSAVDSNGFVPQLLVEHVPGQAPGTAYDLSRGATLGRDDATIRLEDPFASSRHARISREGHMVVIEDLGSTNGTYLNDEPLTGPQPLHPGDRIRIGDCEFSYLQ